MILGKPGGIFDNDVDGVRKMYERPTVDELASTLGIKKKALEADIRDLAWLWEETMGDMELHNPLSALDVLNAIAKAYIRGRNCRMGSYQTLWKHLPTKAAVMYHLAKYVSEKNAPERVYASFSHLRDCGVTSVDEFLAMAGRLNAERTLRQDEERRREREEAKEAGQHKVRDIIEKLRKGREGRYNILDEIKRFIDQRPEERE